MNRDTHHHTARAHPRCTCRRQIIPDLTTRRVGTQTGVQKISRATVDLEDLLLVEPRVITSDIRKSMVFWVRLAGRSSETYLKTRRRSMRGPPRHPYRRMLAIIVTTVTTVTMEVIMEVITAVIIAVTSVTSVTLDMSTTTIVTTDIVGVEAIHDTVTKTITEYAFRIL